MFSNLQLRPAKPHRRKPSMAAKAGVMKRRVSTVSPASASNVPSISFMESLFGDEFPEAFAASRSHVTRNPKSFTDLPAELLATICEHLSNLDVKRLRLAGRHLAANVDLRIERVYISPNRANLDCLQKILAHSRYKNRVREVVWDDAQLEEYPSLDSFLYAIGIDEAKTATDIEERLSEAIYGQDDARPWYCELDPYDFFSPDGQLTEFAKAILLREDRISRDMIVRNMTIMSVEQSYDIYQYLYREEQDIIERRLDSVALCRAVAEFPNLRRITLTSEVWRPWNLFPVYNTPFYRSLPPGFRKPSVWPWLGLRPRATPAQSVYRDTVMSNQHIGGLPKEFRGYSIIVSTLLAMPSPKIEEFIIDAGNEPTGITHQLIASNNSCFHQTVQMFHMMPLKRLQLVLNSKGTNRRLDWSHVSGLFKQALSELKHLEHLELNLHLHARRDNPDLFEWYADTTEFLPETILRRLKTFAYRNVITPENCLSLMLKKLENAEHITLDNIGAHPDATLNWCRLFHQLKVHYATEPMTSRPSFECIWPFGLGVAFKRSNLVDQEIDAFLHDNAECPFKDVESQIARQFLKNGVGWIVEDRDSTYKVKVQRMVRKTGDLMVEG